MKTALGIVRRDLAALLKNPIALLVVGALLVLPGLYAWYCIIANWDPYANTGDVPVAVVNRDRGATGDLTGDVDVGKQVVEKLEDNNSIDWRFYDSEDEALRDTANGLCYAAIVLPENLSENMVGIFEGSDERPAVYYHPNEKYNAVATKVSDSAAQTLVRQINQSFSSTVNETLLKSIQNVSDEARERAASTRSSATADIQVVQEDIGAIIDTLDGATSTIAGWKTAAMGTSATLAATAEQLPAIRSALDGSSNALGSLREKTAAFESDLAGSILESAGTVSGLSARAASSLSKATQDLESIGDRLEALENSVADPDLKVAVKSLEVVNTLIENAVGSASDKIGEMNDKVQGTVDDVTSATGALSNDIMPQLDTGTYELSASLSKLSGAIGQFEPQITQLRNVLAQTDSALDDAAAAMSDAKALLATTGDHLEGTVTDLGAMGSALRVNAVAKLLDIDSDNVGTFVSSPVQMVTEEIFPISNYGTAVAPFYTNLALWIGCFILVSLIRVEANSEGFARATTTQRYFGRWLLFVILSLLQSQVICGVDILLGIDCANPAAFMAAGAVCSFVYMNLIFALVITFRNIGKTLCILLLIMQVPGSSGMYPIEMMPSFFQFIHPALPFTYGIDAMREALCGMYETAYAGDLCMLLAVVPASLLLGVVIRPRLLNLTQLFDQEMTATGFFSSEIHGTGAGNGRLFRMMRSLAASDTTRDEVEERAWKFNRRYPRLHRMGSIAAFAIPFAFLALMGFTELFFEPTVNTKIFWLVFMLVALLVVQVSLIVLEFVHRTIAEQTRLLGLQILSDSSDESDIDGLLDMAGLLLDSTEPDNEKPPIGTPFKTSAPPGKTNALKGVPTKSALPERRRRLIAKTGPTRDIFLTDLRLGFHSVIGVVVIMLLVITPSLYAWFNIAGSWNPYGHTGSLKVAVANEDEGYKGEIMPVRVNVGDTVVAQLRGNASFDWEFVGKDEAVEGVTSGAYYAAVEIPGSFTHDLMTYLTDDADYPEVTYYTNKKENPIAPLITQKGADSIQESIRTSFTERIDEIALTIASDLLEYATNPSVSDYAGKMGAHLDDATHDMKDGARELNALAGLMRTISSIVDTTGTALEGVKAAGDSAKDALSEAKTGAENATGAFSKATMLIEEAIGSRELDIGGIKKVVDAVIDLLASASEDVPGLVERVIWQVQDLEREHPSTSEAEFDAVLSTLHVAEDDAAVLPDTIRKSQGELAQLVENARADIAKVKAYFTDEIKPAASDLRDSLATAAGSTEDVMNGLESSIEGIAGSTDGLSEQLSLPSSGLGKASERIESSAANIESIRKRLAEALASGDVRQVETVLIGADTETMAARLAAPVEQQRAPMYPLANYGSSMAPFYTVLSLWVGALVMISTMRVHVVEERLEELRRRYPQLRPRNEFFGRYGIFGFIGLLQSSLVLLGDLWLLHIQCAHPLLFFLFGLFIGQVFCLVVYTLTELFGDVGKALCVILLIMQVAASGGTFPVEMLDPLLRDIVPFLPFYHAMSLLQECVAGINWPAACAFVIGLVAIAGIALLVALPLRRPFRKLNDFFEEQLEKTGYM